MTPDQHEMLLAMHKYGGGFASKLAAAWLYADNHNARKLEREFGDLRDTYWDFVDRDQHEQG